ANETGQMLLSAKQAYSPSPSMRLSEHNTEQYDFIEESGFKTVIDNPLSTFSIDVDTASYANVRRFLNRNKMPPKDAVRIEELINYFSYDYPEPQGDAPFAVITEMAVCPWKKDHHLVHIGLQGRKIETANMPPSNLVFLLDVSGSMNSHDKLGLLKKGFKLLTEQLRDKDRVAVAVYAGAAGLVLPSTSGDAKHTILKAIDNLRAGGSTAGAQGIKLAYKTALDNFIENGNNRVILATDGDFNVGVSSDGELVRLIESQREKQIFLTVLGFGTGNLKDSKMEKLADKGNGNYAYIDNLLEAKKVLVKEMGGTLHTIAKDVKLQVEFNPAHVKAYRLIGYENRRLNKEDFNDDKKDAGELGAGHTVTALYEIVPADAPESSAKVDPLKYQESKIKPAALESQELMTVKLRYKKPDENQSALITHPVIAEHSDMASDNFNFSAAVASFGMLLRDSEFKGTGTYQDVLTLAKSSKGKDSEGHRAEFIRLVEMAEMLDKSD
ncbi:VWA domain-containing protein, partial [Desulfococcaceae bacterium HSG7]|nr:VWA domain-containing protein [Desulfococcaceae bacterium HSG7]